VIGGNENSYYRIDYVIREIPETMNGYEVNGMTVSPIKSTSSSATLNNTGFSDR